ncbi:beta-N-acetylhexosaminidase [Candidatus Persebacteraceae bacterium Df01]|jgi:beta-N-acetylhexosaminidase|uniref:beta-N-acetylhexosaminidase n=1 Tax=Candidatus Doriopsillibacter californiensis TaxID=2970740 RepID=A0ABT7QJ88_9GAMM|nr:beta-N-acetylhexosaminidase [Candidatus Persebacteraceae bacterium Df01]
MMIPDISQRLMIALVGDLVLTEQDRQWLRHPAVGGVILFTRNFADSEQLRQLTASVRRAAGKPILIAVDQEGGRVRRFCGDDFLALPAMGILVENPAVLHDAGMVMAAEVLAAGVDLSFAPVLDLAYGRSQVIGNRAFSADSESAAKFALSFSDGMAAAGMASCGKHFPGHGYAEADSHSAFAVDERTFAEIAAADLQVFARCAQAGMPAMMTAHIAYPQCDSAAATFSTFWVKEILRGQLAYKGLIVSDDLTMAGAAIGDMTSRMKAALDVGVDVLLVCQPPAVEEALSTGLPAKENTDNPWLALAPRFDGRVDVGSVAYWKARKHVLSVIN